MGTLMKERPTAMNKWNDLPTFFDDFLSRDILDWALGNNYSRTSTLPAVNIRDTHDSYELEVAAPGMSKDDFNVELSNDTLMISGDMNVEEQNKYSDYTRREFGYTNFQRSFQLPEDSVQSDKIKASYVDGILHISIPKSEEAKTKPPKKIKVS